MARTLSLSVSVCERASENRRAVTDADCPSCDLENDETNIALTPLCLSYLGRGECKVCTRAMEKKVDGSFMFKDPVQYERCTVRSTEPVCDANCKTHDCVESADSDYTERTFIPACHGCTKLGKALVI